MDKRQIGLDIRMWGHPGIGRYLRELLKAISAYGQSGKNFHFLGYAKDEPFLRELFPDALYKKAVSNIYSFREQLELTNFSGQVKLLHVPHFNAPFICRSKLMVTVHDLIYLKDSRYSGSSFGKMYVYALLSGIQKKAKAVIAVSNFTKRDLIASFPQIEERVEVIYEAASPCFRQKPEPKDLLKARDSFGVSSPFILFVGSLKAHKNVPVLLDAFEAIKNKRGIEHELVLVGRKDPKEKALLRRLESMASVRIFENKDDRDLFLLYHLADVLVTPSLWEGFGLPVLEAMSCGTPVICSDRSSLPEIAGDAALYFDPFSPGKLEELLLDVLKDPKKHDELSALGMERAAQFSWESAARQTLSLYERVLS